MSLITCALLVWSAAAFASPITNTSNEDLTSMRWTDVKPALPDEIPVQKLQPDPFGVTETASMSGTPLRPAVAESVADTAPMPLIPVEVWISFGLMVVCFAAYLWVATSDRQ